MKLNEASWDRAGRVILGVALISAALFGHMGWGWIGVLPLVTGIAGVCPFYGACRISTRPDAAAGPAEPDKP